MLLNKFMNNSLFDSFYENTLFPLNVKETDTALLIELQAPGLTKDCFDIQINKNILTIENIPIKQEDKIDFSYLHKEFSDKEFKRSVALPDIIDIAKINAKYKNGILNIKIPKREEEKKISHQIKVG